MNPLEVLTALVRALDGMEKAEEDYDRAMGNPGAIPEKIAVARDAARAVFDNALHNARRMTGVYPRA
jgi:hypothetical protein